MSIYKLSEADRTLSADQQKQIGLLKEAWAAAKARGDGAAAEQAHAQAEAIRGSAGYSGGADGSETIARSAAVPAAGGKSAEETAKWIENYRNDNYDADRGWINGYSGQMNRRSMANYIRQQMDANSKAWSTADDSGKAQLHSQNEALAKLLEENTGGVKSTYDPKTGQWSTKNANLGYGVNTGQYLPADLQEVYYDGYRMTPEQVERYRNDTDRYYNFVDQDLVRNWVDESSGFTGKYAQFVNGPYSYLLNNGTKGISHSLYEDVIGDGFMDEMSLRPVTDAYGNIIPTADYLKNNNDVSDYTRQFVSRPVNGVIEPGILTKAHAGGGSSDSRGSSATGSRRTGRTGGITEQWEQAARQQVEASHDYAVDRSVQELLQAHAEAEAALQAQRDQTDRDERNALDNAALYAETRGDRGGIGKAQYSAIQAAALANRQAVNTAQTRLAAATNSQIAELRAQGEFEKADALLQLAQTYLEKLLDMEKWAAEFGLEQQKFQASVNQWQLEFARKAAAAAQ